MDMRRTGVPSHTLSISSGSRPLTPHTAAYSRFALLTGHGLDCTDLVIVNLSATIRSRPTSRVAPCAMVLVASKPSVPFSRRSVMDLRKKYAHKSALPLLPPARTLTHHSRILSPMAPVSFCPPRNGGFPTMASNPPFSMTSGISIGQ